MKMMTYFNEMGGLFTKNSTQSVCLLLPTRLQLSLTGNYSQITC
jgi:hypothetical protein